MKKLLLITILIGGCATTPPQFETTAYEREGKCKIDYRNQYWGDCYIRAAKADPNFLKVQAFVKKNYPSSNMQYNLLQYLNDDLLERLADNEITIDEANNSFQAKLDRYRSVTDREIASVAREKEDERQKAQLALQQLSESLRQANTTLSGNNTASNQNNQITPSKLKVSFRLQSSYMNGYQKVCVYAYRTHTRTWTTSSLVTCPSTKHFDNPE